MMNVHLQAKSDCSFDIKKTQILYVFIIIYTDYIIYNKLLKSSNAGYFISTDFLDASLTNGVLSTGNCPCHFYIFKWTPSI